MSFIHEPRRTTSDIRKLRTYVAEDAAFASVVFDLREVMDTHCATSNQMRAALRLVLHDSDWRVYRRAVAGLPLFDEEEEEDVEEDGYDPAEG